MFRTRSLRDSQPPKFPVAAQCGRQDLLRVTRLRTDLCRDRWRARHDPIGELSQSLNPDADDVSRLDRTRAGRRSAENDITGQQGDGPRQVGDQVMHVPLHLVGVARLCHGPIHESLDRLVPKVPVVHQTRPDRTERVGALHSQHRARVGVAEVVEPVVVGDGVPPDVITGFAVCDVAADTADHDCDLTLIVQEPAPLRSRHRRTMGVECGRRLVEVRRRGRKLRHELGDPARVVEVTGDDFRRCHGRQVSRSGRLYFEPVMAFEQRTVPGDVNRCVVDEDSAIFGHLPSR